MPTQTPRAGRRPLFRLSFDRRVAAPLLATLATHHAPAGGIDLAGKHFEGGQFVPSDVVAQAQPSERKHLVRDKAGVDESRPYYKGSKENPYLFLVHPKADDGKDKEYYQASQDYMPAMAAQTVRHLAEHARVALEDAAHAAAVAADDDGDGPDLFGDRVSELQKELDHYLDLWHKRVKDTLEKIHDEDRKLVAEDALDEACAAAKAEIDDHFWGGDGIVPDADDDWDEETLTEAARTAADAVRGSLEDLQGAYLQHHDEVNERVDAREAAYEEDAGAQADYLNEWYGEQSGEANQSAAEMNAALTKENNPYRVWWSGEDDEWGFSYAEDLEDWPGKDAAPAGPTTLFATYHAPAGFNRQKPLVFQGHRFVGGQFIPNELVQAMPAELRGQLERRAELFDAEDEPVPAAPATHTEAHKEPAAPDAGAFYAIGIGDAGRVGGFMVRRTANDTFRLEKEGGRGHETGSAKDLAEYIGRETGHQKTYGRKLAEAVRRAEEFPEPDWTDSAYHERAAKAFAALPNGAPVVSLDEYAGTKGRTGRIVKDDQGRNRVKLDGEDGYASNDVEPLETAHSWRRPQAELEAEAQPKAKQAGLFEAAETPEPERTNVNVREVETAATEAESEPTESKPVLHEAKLNNDRIKGVTIKVTEGGIAGTRQASAYGPDGSFLGNVSAGENDDGTWTAYGAHVNEAHRRKGIATALYDALEATGAKMAQESRSHKRSSDSEGFWEDRRKRATASDKKPATVADDSKGVTTVNGHGVRFKPAHKNAAGQPVAAGYSATFFDDNLNSTFGKTGFKTRAEAEAYAESRTRGEAPKPAAGPPETAKEPWQMTRQDHREASEADVDFPTYRLAPAAEALVLARLRKKGTKAKDIAHAQELMRYHLGDLADMIHKAQIEVALKAGKPVPPEVLKEYPELAKKEEAKPAAPPATNANAAAAPAPASSAAVWRQKLVDAGNDYDDVKAAHDDAVKLGLDPTAYDDLERLQEAVRDAEEKKQPAGPDTAALEKIAGASKSRAELQAAGYRNMVKSSDLFDHGYSISHWFNPATKDEVVEYTPRAVAGQPPSTLPRLTASDYATQKAIHEALGAPVLPPAGKSAEPEPAAAQKAEEAARAAAPDREYTTEGKKDLWLKAGMSAKEANRLARMSWRWVPDDLKAKFVAARQAQEAGGTPKSEEKKPDAPIKYDNQNIDRTNSKLTDPDERQKLVDDVAAQSGLRSVVARLMGGFGPADTYYKAIQEGDTKEEAVAKAMGWDEEPAAPAPAGADNVRELDKNYGRYVGTYSPRDISAQLMSIDDDQTRRRVADYFKAKRPDLAGHVDELLAAPWAQAGPGTPAGPAAPQTPRDLFGHDLKAAEAAGWKFEHGEAANGNPPPYYATSPAGDRFVWNNSMTHGGADPWDLVSPAKPAGPPARRISEYRLGDRLVADRGPATVTKIVPKSGVVVTYDAEGDRADNWQSYAFGDNEPRFRPAPDRAPAAKPLGHYLRVPGVTDEEQKRRTDERHAALDAAAAALPAADRRAIEAAVADSVRAKHEANRFDRHSMASLYDEIRQDHPGLTHDQFLGVVLGLGRDRRLHLIPFTQPLGELKRPELGLPMDREIKWYLDADETNAPPKAEPAAPAKGPAAGVALAHDLQQKLAAGEQIDSKTLFAIADRHHGGSRAQGKYGPSDAYDALEAAFNQNLKGKTDPAADLATAQEEARKIKAQIDRLPTQTNRSGNKDSFQQFSTPPHYAFGLAWLANLKPGEVVWEPSAGTGCIAQQAENAGADVYANELDPKRAEHLVNQLGADHVTTENAEHLSAILPAKNMPRPTAILMNPPFSQTAGRMGDSKDTMVGANHIEEAMRFLADGGRLVSIVGRGMDADSPTFRAWFERMRAKYNFRANVTLPGAEYAKYGTHFGTRVLIFDKTGPTTAGPVTGQADGIPDLMAKLAEVRDDRPETPAGDRVAAAGGAPGQPPGGAAARPAGSDQLWAGDDAAPSPVVGLAAEPAGDGPAGEALPGGPEAAGRQPVPGGELPGAGAGAAGRGTPGGAAAAVADPGGAPGVAPPAAGRGGRAKKSAGRAGAGGGAAARGQPARGHFLPVPELRPAAPVPVTHVEARQDPAPARAAAAATEAAEAKQDDAQTAQSLFESWRPRTMSVEGAQPHPSPLAESAAMAAVRLPRPRPVLVLSPDLVEMKTVKDKLPDGRTVERHLGLSDAGLEAVQYMAQAHEEWLPGEGGARENAYYTDPSGHEWQLVRLGTGESEKWHLLNGPGGQHLNFLSRDDVEKHLREGGWKDADGKSVGGEKLRRGMMSGDGTGTGKGRQVAAIMAHNINQGRPKHVWVSLRSGLINDARRDLMDMGLDGAKLFDFADLKGKSPPADGICFITYATLRAGPKDKAAPQNIDTLTAWLGKDFEGVVAFDEAHAMANSAGNVQGLEADAGFAHGDASQQAVAGMNLQRRLPKARVGYWTATGATEVENLAYATRLGLWGPGTEFANQVEFINEMNRGGVGAMEAVAQSLKATGAYNARTLSMNDGTPKGTVVTEKLEHALEGHEAETYDAVAEGWQHVLRNINAILQTTNAKFNRAAKGAANSQFWSSQQRFFNQMLCSFQTRSVIDAMRKDVAEGRAPVVQLVNTMEASTNRALASMKEGDTFDDVDVSPAEILVNYLKQSFPVHRYEKFKNLDGSVGSRLVRSTARAIRDIPDLHLKAGQTIDPANVELAKKTHPADVEGGDPVEDPEAVAKRDALITDVANMRIPESPLDQLVKAFGPDKLAEITGRKTRFVWVKDKHGNVVKDRADRHPDRDNQAEIHAFQDGQRDALVFSGAGNTGASYHADKRARNQKQRVHYVLQPGWSAAPLVQSLGRTHRTNQASAPIVRPVAVPQVPGNKRFLSSAARRLEQMGALTRGQKQAASGGLYGAEDNLESREAQVAVDRFFEDLQRNRIDGLHYEDVMHALGFETEEEDAKGNVRPKAHPEIGIRKFLNRLLALKLGMQNQVFEEFHQRHLAAIRKAEDDNTLAHGVEDFPDAQNIHVDRADVIHRDPASGAEVRHLTATVHTKVEKTPWKELQRRGTLLGFARNKISGKLWAVYEGGNRQLDDGQVVQTYRLLSPNSVSYAPASAVALPHHVASQRQAAKFDTVPTAQAEPEWHDLYAKLPDSATTVEHFVTGALLPVWKRLASPTDMPRIYRLKLDDGSKVVGRHIRPEFLDQFRANFNLREDAPRHEAADVYRRLEAGEAQARLSNGWRIVPVRAGHENRLEIKGWSSDRELEPLVQQYGLIKEKFNYKHRFFIPTGPKGAAALAAFTENRPVTQVEPLGGASLSTRGGPAPLFRLAFAPARR